MVDQDSNSSGETPVTRALEALGISYRFFRHEGEVTSLEQAARERDQSPQQVIRSIVFRLSEGEFVMVLVAGPAQISWPALRAYLGQSRLTLATKDEILAVTGYPIGAVSPFGLPNPLRIIMDRSVIQDGEISIGSGVRNTTVILDGAGLIRALGQIEIAELIHPDT
ncbi:MAG: aminoacyl-tRNA deacylase [Anaerolineales bacterium]|jgi:Cys-tRNA(Pro)/Cys-tRNA(Cys) deacylase